MKAEYIRTAEYELRKLEELRKTRVVALERLKKYEDTRLVPSSGRKRSYYYAIRSSDNKRTYLGGDSNKEVQGIREHRYLKQLLGDVESEIDNLKKFLRRHTDVDYEAVSTRLPKIYRTNDLTELFADASEKGRKWKKAKEEEKGRFPIKHPEKLLMTALDGTPVRSKSELVIANLLISNGIPYIYELPKEINGTPIYTDFTILSTIDYQTEILIEHEGMMDQPFYQRLFLDKVNAYLEADIVPGIDIFFTFDDLRGGFDPSAVQDIIDTRLKPRQQA